MTDKPGKGDPAPEDLLAALRAEEAATGAKRDAWNASRLEALNEAVAELDALLNGEVVGAIVARIDAAAAELVGDRAVASAQVIQQRVAAMKRSLRRDAARG